MTPVAQFHISTSRHARPPSQRSVYCDGSHDALWREGQDLELSHWVPNVTATRWKADTSTGVALRFLDAGAPGGYDLVVNDHVDTDGLLASLVLLHPERALPHRELLLQVAAMGDFAAWGEPAAQLLYQALVLERLRGQAAGADALDLALHLHRWLLDTLDRPPAPQAAPADPGVLALQRAVDAVEQGRIQRQLLGDRLVHYQVPLALGAQADADVDQPPLDRPLHAQAVLPPQARARLDAQRLQILSIERGAGRWTHELLWPSYAWADTVTLWRPPGLRSTGQENAYRFELPLLQQAVLLLDRRETAPGRWCLASALSVFESLPGRHFPVVLSFLHQGAAAASALPPAEVRALLQPALG